MKAVTRYSILSGLSLLWLVLFLSLTSAGDAQRLPDEYTILCSAEKTTGFNWRNGEWKLVQFKNSQRLIVVSKENECYGDQRGDIDMEEFDYHIKFVCLTERELGKEYDPVPYYCEERYRERTRESEITCESPQMILSPNGWYHYGVIFGDISNAPKDGRKDSLYVEVGKCSMIKP